MRPVFYVHEQKLIEDLLQEFRNKRMHFAVVVDEFGGTSGIVTLEDIMEEIIGDIHDEFDDEISGNKKIDDFNYIFEGRTMINDVCKVLHLPTETFDKVRGDSDSLAGLLLEIAGEFPQVNEEVTCNNFTFIPLVIECLYFLLVIVYFFYNKIQNDLNTSIYFQPVFWISVGFLIYFSGNFFLFLFSRSMINDPEFRIQYTIIYDSVTIIKNIFICTAIIVHAKNDDQLGNSNKNINIDLDTAYPLIKNTNL